MSRQYCKLIIVALITLVAGNTITYAAPKKDKKKSATHVEQVDIYELSIDENLQCPVIDKEADKIVNFQYQQALSLKKNNFMVETMRNGEVLVVTIPAGALFAPNDTTLSDVGKEIMRQFLKFLKTPGYYKMVLAMHSDNTGSSKYLVGLTRNRVNAIFDWMDAHANVDFVVPYALGSTEPLVANNSIENRKQNRRLEIYLIPEAGMINAAQKDQLHL